MGHNNDMKISGLLLTGGIIPHQNILDLLNKTGIPVLCSAEDTYTVASKVFSLTVKTQASDLSKLEMIKNLYETFVDQESLFKKINMRIAE